MEKKVLRLLNRLDEVEELLGSSEALADQKKYKELTQEHSYLSDLREVWNEYQRVSKRIEEDQAALSEESDQELVQLLQEELPELQSAQANLESQIELLLVPPDPRDNRNIILELRAGTGGEEAALFVGNCVRMYRNYASLKGWSVETLSASESDRGGFKECIMVLSGKNVFRLMQFEGGTHRVQRVPETESQGRVHTSAITAAILFEPEEDEQIEIKEADLKVDTYRASGAGGQHVNTTDSAVRITHMPTGIVVTCQEERSQHKNREKAMRFLRAKVAEEQRKKHQQEVSSLRSSQVGTGDRSGRIRTYNFPQNRVTDHRIDLTLYKLDRILNGELDELTNALVSNLYQKKLQE